MWPGALDEHQNIRLDFDADSPTLLGFENAGRVSTSQLIDGEFPAVDRLVRRRISDSGRSQQAGFARRHQPCGFGLPNANAPIRMTFTGQEVALSAGSVDEAQANETLDIDMDGDDITVAFNPSYLKEGLSAVTEPFVRIKMTTPVKPVEFNGQQEADSDEFHGLPIPARADAL